MKISRIFQVSVPVALVALSSCAWAENGETEGHKLTLELVTQDASAQSCVRSFEAQEWRVEERLCGNSDDGISISFQSEPYGKYPWFDPEFGTWSMLEGCSAGACSYELLVSKNADIIEMDARYEINLTKAHYKLRPEGEILTIIESSQEDLPS